MQNERWKCIHKMNIFLIIFLPVQNRIYMRNWTTFVRFPQFYYTKESKAKQLCNWCNKNGVDKKSTSIYRILAEKPESFRRRWESNIKLDIEEEDERMWTGFIWIRRESSTCHLRIGQDNIPSGSIEDVELIFSLDECRIDFTTTFLYSSF
jgi:hypothetical protein